MPTTVIDNIKGSDLPLPWLKKTKQNPNATFKIILEVKSEVPRQKVGGKWKRFADEMRQKSPLSGAGDFVLEQSKKFREDFSFKHDNEES
ncbi:MAG: hypothetical protein R6U68_08610 [Desulfobacteraceae bacterium]